MGSVKFTLYLFLTFSTVSLFSQKGKNAAINVGANSTVRVNEFTSLTVDANSGSTILSVSNNALNSNSRFGIPLTSGDLIMIIQMQGAIIKSTFNPSWSRDSTYGEVSQANYMNAGNYEFAEVKSTISNNQIELTCGLNYSYNSSGKTQIVRIPRLTTLNISNTGTLTTDPWNGSTGGILVAEINGNTVVNNGGIISVNGLGFRGGAAIANGGSTDPSFGSKNSDYGAEKGEGIGSDGLSNAASGLDILGTKCRGAAANGGGGGNSNNCGGGGGGNGGNISNYNGYGVSEPTFNTIWELEWIGRSNVISSGGGKGGYGTSQNNLNPTLVGPNNVSWGTFKRQNNGGFGGRPLDYSTGKIFMGGGGGAGHMTANSSNGTGACSGGNGGGMVFLLNYGTISGTGTISANGSNGGNSFGTANIFNPNQGIDGAGGAGAGGTIILKSNGIISNIIVNANGGRGGNQVKNNVLDPEGQGPGGGGSGGYITSTNIGFTQNVNGGLNGTTNAPAFDTEFPMNGATSGGSGTNGQLISPSFTLTTSSNQTLCLNNSTTLTATTNNSTATVLWYNLPAGGNSIASGTVYTTPIYTIAGTYTVYSGTCPGLYREPIIITVNNGPTLTVNSPTICPNQSATLTANGATSYTWSTSANTNSIIVSPSLTTNYTITGKTGSCVSSLTTQIVVSPTPTITVPSLTTCSGNSNTLTASGANSYTWANTGQITSSIVVNPSSTTIYTITGSNGACTNTTTSTVSVTATPTLIANSATICPNQTATLNVSGANSFTWSPGNITGNTYTANPVSNTTVSVVGANGLCTSSITRSITIGNAISISVNNPTICSGQSITLSASGAASYTWNTGANTNTISVNPLTTAIYTVSGTQGGCNGSNTLTVTVISTPTLSIPSKSICSGNSTTLTVNGAISYTWSPSSSISNSLVVNPNTTSIYTITGSNGICNSTITASVNVTSTPTLIANSTTICPNQTATLNVSGANSFTWSPGNVIGNTYTSNPVSNITVSIIGANGSCTASITRSITIGNAISISVNNPTICSGQSITLLANGATSYTWNTGANTNSISVNPITTSIYTVSGTLGSCNGSNTSTVSVVSTPTLSVPSKSICSGNSTTLTANGAISYTWSPSSSISNSLVVNPNTTTIYTITGSNGICSSATTSTVNVTATPTLIVNSTTICIGQTATLNVTGATNYTWMPNNVNSNTYTLAPTSNSVISVLGAIGTCTSIANPSITIISPPILTINSPTICSGKSATLTVNGANTYLWSSSETTNSVIVNPTSTQTISVIGYIGNCSSTTLTTITVKAAPSLTVNSTTICSGQTATLNVIGANTYTWSNNAIGNNLVVSPNTTTSYTVTGTALNGCNNSIISIGNVSVTTTPTITVISSTICSGKTATLLASGANSFTWNTNETTASISITPTINTTYTVVGAIGNCTNSATGNVDVVLNPTLTVSSNKSSGCSPLSIGFSDVTSSGCSSILYNFGDGTNGNTNNPNHTYMLSGSYSVTTICTNTFGCANTFILPNTIEVFESPKANFNIEPENSITVRGMVNLTNTSLNSISNKWDLCNGLFLQTKDVNTSYADTGRCCIKLTAINGQCKDSLSKCILILDEPTIIIPNVFTPNDDKSNDVFKITSTGLKKLTCTIYDRWGLKLYEWDGINGFWDGTTTTGKANDGTYFYIVTYTNRKDETKTEKGFLNLFKQ